jgi:hypothetical protein
MSTRARASVNSAKWAAYAAAGAAATLAAQNADAAITVVDYDLLLEDSTPDDGFFDTFIHSFGASGASLSFLFAQSATSGAMAIRGWSNLSIAGFATSGFYYPSNLAYGANLSTQAFGVLPGERGDMVFYNGYSNSQFVNTGGYIGFQFDLGGGTQWGWAELSLEQGTPVSIFRLETIAWGGVGEAITVGQVPGPGALAMLALGAVGVGGWRRKRTA